MESAVELATSRTSRSAVGSLRLTRGDDTAGTGGAGRWGFLRGVATGSWSLALPESGMFKVS